MNTTFNTQPALANLARVFAAAPVIKAGLARLLSACIHPDRVWHGQDPWRTIATGHVVVQASALRKILDHLHGSELARMSPELDGYTPSTVWKHADAIESFLHASHQTTGVTIGDYFNRYAQ